MDKKNILIIFLFLITAGSAIYFIWFKTSSDKFIVHEEELLSQRASDYLQKKKQEDVKWRRLNFEKEEVDKNQILGEISYQVGNCFTITIPFPVKLNRQKSNCHQYFSINEPRGKINAYQSETQIKDLDEDPGVKLRRKGDYDEEIKIFNGREFTIFSKSEPKQEITAFNLLGNQLLVISLTTSSNKDLEENFRKMIRSIQFSN